MKSDTFIYNFCPQVRNAPEYQNMMEQNQNKNLDKFQL